MISANTTDHPGVVAWPPLIFLACAGVGALLHFLVPVRVLRYSVSLAAGVCLAVVAAALAIWAGRVMKAAGTNVRPDRPALTVVTSGPYRFTRNPMYLSLGLLQLAVGLILDGLIPILFVVPLALILHYGVVLREESYLERKFGDSYVVFKKHVRRWI